MSGAADTLVIGGDDLEVELLPAVGGRVHRIRAFGHDLLRTPRRTHVHRHEPFFWGAYPMAPWCNRAPPGRQRVAGRTIDLVPNFVDGSAIHGLVATAPWQRLSSEGLEIGVDTDRWPWPFTIRLDASVERTTLRLRYRLVNRSDAPMPAGLGLHPWFRAPLEVRLPARSVYRSNSDSPHAPEPAVGRFDLATRAPPAPGLDATWTGIDEPVLELAWPGAGVAAWLSAATSAPAILVALASPADLGAVAIEPQTHGPHPLRRLEHRERDAPSLLPPGGSLTLDLGLEVVLARNLR